MDLGNQIGQNVRPDIVDVKQIHGNPYDNGGDQRVERPDEDESGEPDRFFYVRLHEQR